MQNLRRYEGTDIPTDRQTDRQGHKLLYIKDNCSMKYNYSPFSFFTAVIRQNHVLEGIASQISTLGENKAERAVDGSADNIYAHNSCSATHKETDPWWMFTFNYVILFSDVAIVSADNGKLHYFYCCLSASSCDTQCHSVKRMTTTILFMKILNLNAFTFHCSYILSWS